uniref:Uncharacterized protein n=1 Tax=Rhizophora mucronata TaxID=61149 RepID=A0A2P2QWC3_RHIMU
MLLKRVVDLKFGTTLFMNITVEEWFIQKGVSLNVCP